MTEMHGIACCCNDCLDRQVATVTAAFGPMAGEEQRLQNERFIRRKASFWDAFLERWHTPHAMTPMPEAKAMVEKVAALVAEYKTPASPTGALPLPLQIMACDCESRGVIANNARYYCNKSSGGPFCTCRCHPENQTKEPTP